MYLQVINSYIYLLIEQEHMKQHPGGIVHMEITFVREFLKRDAGDDQEFNDIYYRTSERSQFELKVLLYLQHDMVKNILLYISLVIKSSYDSYKTYIYIYIYCRCSYL
jgi:hypothetical protein